MPLFDVPSRALVLLGDKHSTPWLQFHTNVAGLLKRGYPPPVNNAHGQLVPASTVIPLAKLTPGGVAGSLTFTNGILTKAVNPT